ncbi:hypothetical protein O181_106013, partial [Austropuccinia psidii MF-1]|nr:hypothetical protein [Austropuccinia psidii MF-1]
MLQPYRMTTNHLTHISLPCGYYVMQSMDSWIEWFLGLEGIKDAIESWAREVNTSNNNNIIDIKNGRGWKEISWDYDSNGSR